MEIKKIVVAGAGTMGYSMAQILARYHYQVSVYDLNQSALDHARRMIVQNTNTMIHEKEISESKAVEVLNNLSYSTSKECFKDCDLVIESIVENLVVKQAFYQEISRLVKNETILATNTSGLSINAIAKDIQGPERFIGMHWFNPSHLILLIEIIKGDQTSEKVANAIYDLSLAINKKPVIVYQDVPGFAANRIQFAILREALSLVEQGVVTKEGIDDVMKYGLGFRYACLGPLEVADFGGLDTFYHISEYLMKDLCDSKEIPTLLKQFYQEGKLGVKTQAGFYQYPDGKDIEATKKRDELLLKLFNALYK